MTMGRPPEIHTGEFKAGDIIGGTYEIVDLIGHGSMGNVYRARHQIMQEQYALKTLRAEKLTDVSWKRFQIEAQSVAKMNHPNIVTIYNFGLHEKTTPFYVMTEIKGKDISELVAERGPLPAEEVLPIFIEVCSGMQYAHSKNIIHRDIKPPNIVVLDEPQGNCHVKIVDFGIAKITGEAADNKQQLTNIGEVCGSPLYMSPEQCEGSTIDVRSDIYSLGCTLYEALTGAPPFRGRNVVDTMLKHQSEKPLTLKEATGGRTFHPMLERVVAIMLAKAPGDRYQDMATCGQDLQAIIGGVAAPIGISSGVSTTVRSGVGFAATDPTKSGVAFAATDSTTSSTKSGVAFNAVNSTKSGVAYNAAPDIRSASGNSAAPYVVPLAQFTFSHSSGAHDDDDDDEQEKTVAVNAASMANQINHQTTHRLNPRPAASNRQAPSYNMAGARASQDNEDDLDDEDDSFQSRMPSHFVRLMVGSFIVITLVLAALGYWWIQPSTSSGPHPSAPSTSAPPSDAPSPK